MTATREESIERVHNLFEDEVEGRIVEPRKIHELFMDDEVNAAMDQTLQNKKPVY
jgi:hypothetical protein